MVDISDTELTYPTPNGLKSRVGFVTADGTIIGPGNGQISSSPYTVLSPTVIAISCLYKDTFNISCNNYTQVYMNKAGGSFPDYNAFIVIYDNAIISYYEG